MADFIINMIIMINIYLNIPELISGKLEKIKRLHQYNKKIKQDLEVKKKIFSNKIADIKPRDSSKITHAMLTKKTEYELTQAVKSMEENNETVYFFTKTLLDQNVPLADLQNLIENIDNLKISHNPQDNLMLNIGTAGRYISKQNEIQIFDDDVTTEYHELFHRASDNPNNDNIGFCTKIENKNAITNNFGVGLNEGYTEKLTNRFFNNDGTAYLYFQKLSELIESFYIDKIKMIDDYFNSSLEDLISELLNSMTKEEAIEIIADMDELLYHQGFKIHLYLKIRKMILDIKNRNHNYEHNTKKQLIKKNTISQTTKSFKKQ